MLNKKIINLASNDANQEAVRESARALLQDAESGNLKGLSYTASYTDSACNLHTTGCHADNPIFAVGAAMMLVYKLLKDAGRRSRS